MTEEQYLRLKQEAARRRKHYEQQQQQLLWDEEENSSEEEEEDEEHEFHLVRGRDGRLYPIKNPAYARQQQQRRRHRTRRHGPALEPKNRHKLEVQDDGNDEEKEFDIVRGLDGRLYTVQQGKFEEEDHQPRPSRFTKKKKTISTPQSMKQNQWTVPVDEHYDDDDSDSDASSHSSSSSDEDDMEDMISTGKNPVVVVSDTTKKHPNSTTNKRKRNKKKIVAVIVEDASESEYEKEENNYNSPWRNRRPSPGQWIEPVENYIP